jgi:hypothetical protein
MAKQKQQNKQKQENKQVTKQTVKVNVNVLTKKKKTKRSKKSKQVVRPQLLPQMPPISYSYSPGSNVQTASSVPPQPLRENPEPSSTNNIMMSTAASTLSNLALAAANAQNIGQVNSRNARGGNARNRSMSVGNNPSGGIQNISAEDQEKLAQEFAQVKTLTI